MDIKIRKKEIQGLKNLFKDQQDALDIIESYARILDISETLEYPVKDFKDLLNKTGDTEIEWLKQKIRISELESIIPESYFPIVDQDDLLYKAQPLIRSMLISRAPEIRPREKVPELPSQLKNYKSNMNFPGFSTVRIESA